MKNLLIKYIALQYDYRLFGKTRAHLRVVNPFVLFFCIAGLYNLLTPGFDLVQVAVFIPAILILVAWFNFRKKKFSEEQLTWEQYFQQLCIEASNQYELKKLNELEKVMRDTFERTRAKNVEAMRFWFPWIIILITLIIWGLKGFREAGFDVERFF